MFIEDCSPYFADFGVIAQGGDRQSLVLLDAPEHDVLGGRATSSAYAMTYTTASFPELSHGDQVRLGDTESSVIAVNKQSDGVIGIATLQRT